MGVMKGDTEMPKEIKELIALEQELIDAQQERLTQFRRTTPVPKARPPITLVPVPWMQHQFASEA